jgi:hypothetical protein
MTEEKDKDKQREQRKKHLIKLYKQIVAEKKELPIRQDFLEHDISKDVLARAFGGIENMHEYMKQEHGIFLDKHFSTIEKLFSPERSAVNSNKKRFIITTAVAGSKAHLGFLSTIDKYCEENNAQAVIMPAESITNSFEKQTAVFDQAFNDPKYLFVSEDTPLNNNISLRNIQVSAKQIKPITGLLRIGKREGSYVFAAPKQFLEHDAWCLHITILLFRNFCFQKTFIYCRP